MEAPAPQPDFNQLSQHLAGISAQIALIPNMPAVVGVEAAIADSEARMRRFIAQEFTELRNEIRNQFRDIGDQLGELRVGQMHLPIQLHNAASSLDALIVYPPGVVVGAEFPGTKQDLLQMPARLARDVARALGLPALPANSNLRTCRQQVIDFLGCGMVAQ